MNWRFIFQLCQSGGHRDAPLPPESSKVNFDNIVKNEDRMLQDGIVFVKRVCKDFDKFFAQKQPLDEDDKGTYDSIKTLYEVGKSGKKAKKAKNKKKKGKKSKKGKKKKHKKEKKGKKDEGYKKKKKDKDSEVDDVDTNSEGSGKKEKKKGINLFLGVDKIIKKTYFCFDFFLLNCLIRFRSSLLDIFGTILYSVPRILMSELKKKKFDLFSYT